MAGAARTHLIGIRRTPLALGDLKAIWSHVEKERNLATANKICRLIYDAIQTLRRFPESGRIGIEKDTRELVVSRVPYIVAYQLRGSKAVEILRIWHGAQER